MLSDIDPGLLQHTPQLQSLYALLSIGMIRDVLQRRAGQSHQSHSAHAVRQHTADPAHVGSAASRTAAHSMICRSLASNRLETLAPSMFANLDNLTELYLGSNSITELNAGTFNAPNLQVLFVRMTPDACCSPLALQGPVAQQHLRHRRRHVRRCAAVHRISVRCWCAFGAAHVTGADRWMATRRSACLGWTRALNGPSTAAAPPAIRRGRLAAARLLTVRFAVICARLHSNPHCRRADLEAADPRFQ